MDITTTLVKLKEYFTNWHKDNFYELHKDFNDNTVYLKERLFDIATIISNRLDGNRTLIKNESDIQNLIERNNSIASYDMINLQALDNRIKKFECNTADENNIDNIKTTGVYKINIGPNQDVLLVFNNNDVIYQIKCIDNTAVNYSSLLKTNIVIRSKWHNDPWGEWISLVYPQWQQLQTIELNKNGYKTQVKSWINKQTHMISMRVSCQLSANTTLTAHDDKTIVSPTVFINRGYQNYFPLAPIRQVAHAYIPNLTTMTLSSDYGLVLRTVSDAKGRDYTALFTYFYGITEAGDVDKFNKA